MNIFSRVSIRISALLVLAATSACAYDPQLEAQMMDVRIVLYLAILFIGAAMILFGGDGQRRVIGGVLFIIILALIMTKL